MGNCNHVFIFCMMLFVYKNMTGTSVHIFVQRSIKQGVLGGIYPSVNTFVTVLLTLWDSRMFCGASWSICLFGLLQLLDDFISAISVDKFLVVCISKWLVEVFQWILTNLGFRLKFSCWQKWLRCRDILMNSTVQLIGCLTHNEVKIKCGTLNNEP